MSIYKRASAIVRHGTAGPMLIVKSTAYEGIAPPRLEKIKKHYVHGNTLLVVVLSSVPKSPILIELGLTYSLSKSDQLEEVELHFGQRISVLHSA